MTAPRLVIDLEKIEHNARTLVGRLATRNIRVTGVTKATLGSPAIAGALLRAGVTGLGDSRIENLEAMVQVEGVDVFFIGSGDLSQSMGYVGQQTHPEVQKVMERGVEIIRKAGRFAGVSCPENLVPKYLDLGVQYFHGTVQTLIQTASNEYLNTMRKAAGDAGL